MGTALTLGLNAHLSDAVSKYFDKFQVLPPRNVRVGTTKKLSGPETFENLLEAIVADKATTEFVIVVHGHEDGSGLFLRLANRGNGPVGAKTTHDKLKLLMTIAGRKPVKIEQDDRDKLELKDAEINRLLDLMQKVRDKKITAVEFRGCNLGRNVQSVSQFRSFFGAASFGAPKLHSFFGLNPTGTGANLMSNHAASHNGTTFVYRSTLSGKTCLCCIGVNDARKPQNGHIIADDDGTLDLWIQTNFDSTAKRGNAKQLPIHGLWKFPEIKIDDPDPLANLDPRPIFPLAVDGNGKNEYQLHVVYSP